MFRLWSWLCGLTAVMFLRANHSILEIYEEDLDLFIILLMKGSPIYQDWYYSEAQHPRQGMDSAESLHSLVTSPRLKLLPLPYHTAGKHDTKRPNWSTLLRARFAKGQRRWTLTLWAVAMSISCFRQSISSALISAVFKIKNLSCEHDNLALIWGQMFLLQVWFSGLHIRSSSRHFSNFLGIHSTSEHESSLPHRCFGRITRALFKSLRSLAFILIPAV